MSTRIRYDKTGSILRSKRPFTTSKGEVFVELNTKTMTFNLLSSLDLSVVATGGSTKNLAVLKIQAKESLASLGVNFQVEERNRESQDENTSSL